MHFKEQLVRDLLKVLTILLVLLVFVFFGCKGKEVTQPVSQPPVTAGEEEEAVVTPESEVAVDEFAEEAPPDVPEPVTKGSAPRITALNVYPPNPVPGDTVQISIDITNTGEKRGKEVVQLYICDIESRLPRPPKELKGFRKISLLPGERKSVAFTLEKEAFSFYDPELKQWVAEPGEFEIQVGSSSRDIRARTTLLLVP